ncbi:hypothetical protein [Aestuariivirga sp.]|uniref:hypothetical protein n=1 Tax=Aestuariivirga sp. TaxID=2650926 RepID=UPI0039E61C46
MRKKIKLRACFRPSQSSMLIEEIDEYRFCFTREEMGFTAYNFISRKEATRLRDWLNEVLKDG